jgi:hypothetical protein
MAKLTTGVHVTHEAVAKIGGIGAVLQGLFTSKQYLNHFPRSIIVGPLFSTEGSVTDRLGEDGEVLYSSLDGLSRTEHENQFRQIENQFNAGIIYGRRSFTDERTGVKSSPEVILIDVRYTHAEPVNSLKKQMYELFGVQSDRHEHIWEFEQYVRMAPVAIAALKAIGAAQDLSIVFAHEFMGMPTALAAMADTKCDFKTIFYAHEVATIRRIVENHPGYDTMFYNVLKYAQENSLYCDEVFGDQSDYFKHPLVKASRFCDAICAVGDYASQELKFLTSEFGKANINIVYNGIGAYVTTKIDKIESKSRLRDYCHNLLGYTPDYIFTHVTRLVKSKGLWRDLLILEKIEKQLRKESKTAVMYLLSTETCQRKSKDIYRMESEYNWPVAHREGYPDLSGGEARFYSAIQEFNARSSNIKVVFINQFGFNRKSCGKRMPENMDFMDIRRGSDVEFGLSVYEPFGIAQLEPLTFGGICVVSNVCGCAGFIKDIARNENVNNVIIADFTKLNGDSDYSLQQLQSIDNEERYHVEEVISSKVADLILSRLNQAENDIDAFIDTGYRLARNMSWDCVVNDYFMPCCLEVLSEKMTRCLYASS